ncbi:MAG: 16S rRNA (cytidine(1402)-2'-O)-methyltransferase [Chloroflexi bacterium]|jgi:16S rRNA (cytidine1402-2'-O)-methyltransferase|nr:16S rRNA (cytidine(1402)-2'-O)-methyltransferase [Chloroflexota bacterium]MBT3669314.1 16S rRNA (cytidine(1402)-2'-O)-methyltransferase [Chloroflexota bacterium]MBT4003487.1 16S rRNA (cytidine(1402)-2'-O)-methyltransferase [Chloroflexota bacterium]MBT4306021.1 16S rRNA (cytidine(1402)-2'-O)-methyltransferase [Chloroflexota bacterium]MBT4532665.1 16S rRNA (cytidine(1402)-2'-O)-methyltransferase [Chloroflexota bacterium]
MSTLYLVATPIGNLEDISARALRILTEVKVIACEDTRHSGKLLHHFGIKTPMTSYYEHNKVHKLNKILKSLGDGDVALISDAGTPNLNDPGYLLVNAALEGGHKVSPIPGPSAPISALIVSGLSTDRFTYLGYLPRKQNDRLSALLEVKNFPYTLIFFETPHRMEDSLADIETIFGNRKIAVAGELTKMYEEIFRGSVGDAKNYFLDHPARGEYTLVIEGQLDQEEHWDEAKIKKAIMTEISSGNSPSKIAKFIADQSGWPRRKIYNMIMDMQN